MKKLKVFIILVSLTLAGCAKLRTETTPFYDNNLRLSGTLYVESKVEEAGDALEFKFYKKKIEKALEKKGYSIVNDKNDAKYIALLSYGIGKGSKIVYSGNYKKNYATVSGKKSSSHVMVLSLEIREDDKTVYEVRTRSKGECGVLAAIYDDLLAA